MPNDQVWATLDHRRIPSSLMRCAVAHAGTGSIFTALQLRKPIVVMPRLAAHREHRNDHQLATVEHFEQVSGVNVARDEHALRRMLDDPSALERPSGYVQEHAQPVLLHAIATAIEAAPHRPTLGRVVEVLRTLRG